MIPDLPAFQMIPNLPEEMAWECLVRVPHGTLPLLRRVCRQWKQATESPFFYQLRRSNGSAEHLIIFIQEHYAISAAGRPSLPSYRLAALHQSSREWTTFPTIPLFLQSLPFLCTLAASGVHLVVIGGWDAETTLTRTDVVFVYNFLSGSWSRCRPMPGPKRSFFACAASPNNQIFVAGGHDEKRNALKSAMVYDIAKDEWTTLPDMTRERGGSTGVFEVNKAGLFRVVGGCCDTMQGGFERSAEAFDVGEWRWLPVEEEAVPEGESSKTCVVGGDGRIYVCGGGGKMVMVKEVEEWREVAELPEDVRFDPKMFAWGEGLMVKGTENFGGPPAAYVLEMKQGVTIAWQKLAFPNENICFFHSACCVDI